MCRHREVSILEQVWFFSASIEPKTSSHPYSNTSINTQKLIMMRFIFPMYLDYQILNTKKKNLLVNGKLISPHICGFSQIILTNVNQSLKVSNLWGSL